jgi:hypothetical protein
VEVAGKDNFPVQLQTSNYPYHNTAVKFKNINAVRAIFITFLSGYPGGIKILNNSTFSASLAELRNKRFS